MRIFVAGHSGMVGSAISRKIEKDARHSWFGAPRAQLDLLDRMAVFNYLNEFRPDAVIIAAAKVGGILANKDNPVEFLTHNLQIQQNLMDGSHAADIQRLVFLGSSCIYPKYAAQPIQEEALLTGELEPTNESYAVAKIAGLKLVQAYRRQYGRDWISLMPTNLYGPGDNYDPDSSHVVPGMIRKLCHAKQEDMQSAVFWGSGSPKREFLHVDDLASAVIFALENYSGDKAINIGSGEEISIMDLSEKLRGLIRFEGKILWDTSVPDGTPRKLLDSTLIRSLGWSPSITLDEGLKTTLQELAFPCT